MADPIVIAAEDLAKWELPIPANQVVVVDLAARSAHGYSVQLVNLSLTDHIYYNLGDTTEIRGRQAQAILPGNTNIETVTGHIAFVCASDAKIDIVRA